MRAVLDERLTTSEAARLAGVSKQSIRSWMRAGRLPHEVTPLGALIDPADLDALLLARERAQQAPRGRRSS
jgi:excisionase family DNA binding protein